MKSTEKLTKELIVHIFNSLGIVAPPLWGKAGITENMFKTNKIIKIQLENELLTIPVYSASCNISNSIIKVLTVHIAEQGLNEFSAVIQMDQNMVYGLKLSDADDDVGIFITLREPDTNKEEVWSSPSMYEKLLFCAGIEQITDQGITWVPFSDVHVLFKYLLSVIES